LGRGAIAHRIETGALHVVRRGVYAVGHRALRPRAHVLAAVLAAGPGAVLSHRSAAALWGIRPTSAARADVTVPDRRRGAQGVRIHHAALPPEHVTTHDGIPVTTVERTLLDLAAILALDALRHTLEEAEIQVGPDWRVLGEMAARPRRGARALRRLIEERSDAPVVTRSVLERRFLDFCRRHDLPLPETNTYVEGFEVDCVWRDRRLVAELDSRRHHDHGEAFERDRHRDRVLTTAGWRPIRITWRQQRDEPAALAADLRRLTTA
jgi:very-short-patch-repair endonuclease